MEHAWCLGLRVEIPTYCDLWMMGARFGRVTKVTKGKVHIKLDKLATVKKFPASMADDFRIID